MTEVQLDKDLVESLKIYRQYPRQPYNELIKHMLVVYQKMTVKNQYDEFLHKIQKEKMAEIWDNSVDEVWESV